MTVTTPTPRALLARRALQGATVLGLLADQLLRNGPWGAGLAVWIVTFAAILTALVQLRERAMPRESALWLGVAILAASALMWRDSEILLFFDVLAMLIALGLLALSLGAVPVAGLAVARVRDLIRAAFGTALEVGTGIVPLVLRDAELHAAVRDANEGTPRRLLRALLITLPIVLVFTFLLTQADPIFGSFFTIPDIDVGEVLSHVVMTGFFAWIVAGWMRRSLLVSPATAGATSDLPFALGTTDIALALGALNLLFAAFVVVQVGWLFGGEALVLKTTGLTYAEYARRGFFELTLVAGLLLPVLLGAQALIPGTDDRTQRLYRRLALPLVLLLGAMMTSAGARMQLYVQYYGISTDRLYASAFMIWLAVVFAWLALTVLRARGRAFASGFVLTGFATLLVLNIMNPDALVARANLARGTPQRVGAAGADLRYVASLGGDAVPMVIDALVPPAGTAATGAPAERCVAAKTLLDKWTGTRRQRARESWTQWNSARSSATTAIRAHESELRALVCPDSAVATPGH